tara:strand:+ start:2502 stop:3461 length:960 start_codon:yes stop_codon:yes gene_type:complete
VSQEKRSTAFFMNGGAGRVLSSIPAFEAYEKENPDDDFIIVCEGGMEMYAGHPTLHKRAYDNWHKGLFEEHLKHRNCKSLEPYRIWEYYNQKCNITQAFDIEMSNKGVRKLDYPTMWLSPAEIAEGHKLVKEVRENLSKQRVIVFQPYGRSANPIGDTIVDPGGRSFRPEDVLKIVKKLQPKYGVIMMSEFPTDFQKMGCPDVVAQPEGAPLRIWGGIITAADVFLGCDSVGQHIAHSTKTPSVVCVGATYPENISYEDSKIFQVLDVGADRRVYDPIRLTMEDHLHRKNERVMELNDSAINEIIKEIDKKVTENLRGK